MNKRKLVEEQWNQFAKSVLPKDCSQIQRREMRRAFYAGAHGVMMAVMSALTPGDQAEAEDLTIMEDLHDELMEFAREVKAGRA